MRYYGILKWLNKYEIELAHHVFVRSFERSIDPDMIERTLKNGKQIKFGKNYVKFVSNSIICVGEFKGNKIKIFTVEWRKK